MNAELLKESFDLIAPRQEEFAHSFYEHLFRDFLPGERSIDFTIVTFSWQMYWRQNPGIDAAIYSATWLCAKNAFSLNSYTSF